MIGRVGRNDPCPCGSGKKFKHCCMKKGRAATARRLTIRQEETDLMNQLYRFSQSPTFHADLQAAFILFWNDSQAPDAIPGLDPLDMGRFFDWYVTDYRTSKDRQRVIDLFYSQEGPQLRPLQLGLLRARQSAPLSLYRLLKAHQGDLVMTDMLRSGQHSIQDELWGRTAAPGDLFLTRVIEQNDETRIDRVVTLLPPQAQEGLERYAQTHFERYREEHYGSEWDDFLKESSYLFNHYLLSEEAESWHPAIESGSPYYSGMSVRERMSRALEERARTEAEEPATEQASADAAESAPERAHSPIMLPADLIDERRKEGTPKEDFSTSQGGILLPGRPEHDEHEKPPSILVPGRHS